MREICYVLDGLLIVKTPYCISSPFLITGANVDRTASIRGIQELRQPVRRAFNRSSIMDELEACDFQQAKKFGDAVESINRTPAHSRLKRALTAFLPESATHVTKSDCINFAVVLMGLFSREKVRGKEISGSVRVISLAQIIMTYE